MNGLSKNYGFGIRHIQVLLVFICLTVGYMMRVNISVAIVAMTDRNNSTDVQVFDWNKQTQDFILSSFSLGYMVMQIPAGQISQIYGAKILIGVAMFVNGFASILTPWIASIGGWKALFGLRMVQGLSQAAFFPSMYTFASKWIPNHERSRLSNVMYCGTSIGTILGMPVSSLLAVTSIGWPLIFYAIGSLSLTTGIVWIIFGASSPSAHKFISKEEKAYIESSLGVPMKKRLKTPWKSIFTSLPVYAIIVAHTGCNWGFLMFLMETPSYLKRVLGIDLKASGLLSALPYIAMFTGSIIMSFISDYIVNNEIVTVGTSRKIFNTIGEWLPGIGVIILGYMPPGHEYVCIALIIFIVGSCSGMHMGYMMNHIDLSPNFSGTLMGLTNGVANGVAALGPITAGYILTDDTDPAKWRIVFVFIAVVYFTTNIFFLIFGTSDRQPWNEGIEKMKNSNVQDETDEEANIALTPLT